MKSICRRDTGVEEMRTFKNFAGMKLNRKRNQDEMQRALGNMSTM